MKGALESEQTELSGKFDRIKTEKDALQGTYDALGNEWSELLDEWKSANDQLTRYTEEERELQFAHNNIVGEYFRLVDQENEAR